MGKPIREHTRRIEDIPPVTLRVTAHTIHGYWCSHCKKIVTPKVTAALPRSSLGLRFVVYDDADVKSLIKRLRRHRDEMLTHLDHEGVSPYNNHAEQQMRTA